MSNPIKIIVNWWRSSHTVIKIIVFGLLAVPQLFALLVLVPGTIDTIKDFIRPDPDISGFGRSLIFVAMILFVFVFNIPAILTAILLRVLGNEISRKISFLIFIICLVYNSALTANLLMMTHRSWDTVVELMIFMTVVFLVSVLPPLQYAMREPRRR